MRVETSGQSEDRWLVSDLIFPSLSLCFLLWTLFSFVKMNAVKDGVSFAVRDPVRNISNKGDLCYTC